MKDSAEPAFIGYRHTAQQSAGAPNTTGRKASINSAKNGAITIEILHGLPVLESENRLLRKMDVSQFC